MFPIRSPHTHPSHWRTEEAAGSLPPLHTILVRGFTLIEILVTIGILLILASTAFLGIGPLQRQSDLQNTSQEMVNILRLAQNRTLASEGQSQYGVYFDDTASPHRYTLFKGSSYVSRDVAADEIFFIPESVIISSMSVGGGKEVVFDRIVGTTNQSGQVLLQLVADPTKTQTIYIESSGLVGMTSPSNASDAARIKDSRHVHIEYVGRTIDTATEKLVLRFPTVTKEIPIAQNLQAGQIYWEGTVTDGGEIQKIRVQTHRLNDALLGTQFSIHRDRRFNSKSLTIDIDAPVDPDVGTLIEYAADGQVTEGTSVYVSATVSQ